MSLIGKRYAIALLDVAKENNMIDRMYDEFELVINNITKEKDLWQLFISPSIENNQKKEISKEIFGDYLNKFLLNFLNILIEKNRIKDIKDIFYSFKSLTHDEKNMLEASAITAIAMSDVEKKRLKENLEKKYNKKVLLKNEIDQSIIGGIIVYIGNQVIDGSVRKSLSNLKQELQEIRLQELGVG